MYTIRTDYRDETVIEKSRFICTLKKVSSETEAQDFIKAVKKEFWDATHNCSAYIIDELAQRSSDDGEPSGTAGLPMLEVLRKNQQLFTVASVEYGQQARILLYMKQEQQDEAERWLTEALNTATQLEQVGSEYVEVPAEREK